MLTDYLFLLLTFPIASVLHGGDFFSKGHIVTGHLIISLAAGWFAPIGVALYWLFFRRGKQAKAELGYLSGESSLAQVKYAYPIEIGRIIAWCIRDLKTRREQEAVTGFVLGIICALGGLA